MGRGTQGILIRASGAIFSPPTSPRHVQTRNDRSASRSLDTGRRPDMSESSEGVRHALNFLGLSPTRSNGSALMPKKKAKPAPNRSPGARRKFQRSTPRAHTGAPFEALSGTRQDEGRIVTGRSGRRRGSISPQRPDGVWSSRRRADQRRLSCKRPARRRRRLLGVTHRGEPLLARRSELPS
jgi:hypothetical protein